jgi:molybdate transport system regulatory protein
MWIEGDDGNLVMGEGLEAILMCIEQTGSISQAARQLNMSYRNAWAKIEKTEERLGYALVTRHIGGPGGGGSSLTPEGLQLLCAFSRLKDEIGTQMECLFHTFAARVSQDFKG